MEDRLAIIEVINDWVLWRDSGDWERLRTTWHEGGWMSATWFEGPYEKFIEACRARFDRGQGSSFHILGGSSVEASGNRAIAQTRMTITVRTDIDGVAIDIVALGRFYDFFDKRSGRWAIVRRQPIYEKDRIDAVDPAARLKIDAAQLAQYPEGYRHLAYLQTLRREPISRELPQLRGAAVERLYAEGRSWLKGAKSPFAQ